MPLLFPHIRFYIDLCTRGVCEQSRLLTDDEINAELLSRGVDPATVTKHLYGYGEQPVTSSEQTWV